MKINFSETKVCACCSKGATAILKLDQYPLTEFYKGYDELNKDLNGFLDQSILYCEDCCHLFLSKIIDVRDIYANYLTTTTSSKGAIDCIINFKKFIDERILNDGSSHILDIGGNDGYFLRLFDRNKYKLVNIDANAQGDEGITVVKSFLEDVDLSAFNDHRKIIASSHTIEHLENPSLLIQKIASTASVNDKIFLQFPSLEMMVDDGRFDQICHQHLNYFSLNSIVELLNRHGLSVISHEYDSSHFGTLRVMAQKKDQVIRYGSEVRVGLAQILNRYSEFKNYYNSLQNILKKKFIGQQGYGAGLMVPTLAYYLPLINELRVIYDENEFKNNKRFINLKPKIDGVGSIDVNSPVIITSISTKTAARSIYSKLVSIGCKDITIPTHIC